MAEHKLIDIDLLERYDGKIKDVIEEIDSQINDNKTYDYAPVITIEDAVPANLSDCKVKIEPVQDLHGQSKPYVGGAGDNKMYLNPSLSFPIEQNGITITSDGNNGVYLNGTSTGAVQVISAFKTDTLSGQNTICKLASDDNAGVVYAGNSPSGNYTSYIYGYDTVTGDGSWRLDIYISQAGKTFNNLHLQPMVIMGNSHPTEYIPYENICPISGHTEVAVQRDGRNLCDKGEGNVYNGGKLIPVSAGDKIYCYGEWVSDNKSFYGAIFSTPTETSKGNKIAILDDFYTGVSKEMTIPTNGYFGVCFDTSVGSYTVSKMMVSRTPIASATDYEPFKGKTYTISLGDTIYGGTVDFDSGVMTVTHHYVTKNTSKMNNLEQYPGWTGSGIKQIVGGGINDVVSTCVNVSDVIRANTLNNNDILFFEKNDIGLTQTELIALAIDVAFVVELATPFTVQLTPQQIQLLQGQNTLTASTGQISVTANGVSGAIGAVQEQVNELAEDVTVLDNLISHGFVTIPTGFYCEDAYKAKYTAIGNGTHGIVQINGVVKTSQTLTASTDYTICSVPFTSIREAFGYEFNESGTIAIDKDSGDVVYTPSDSVAQYMPIKFSIAFCF